MLGMNLNSSHLLRANYRRLVFAARTRAAPLLPRMAWFKLKRALRLSTRGDRVFLVEELIRALEAGRIGRQLFVTATGKRDGAGAQTMAKMSALCVAKAHGLTYLHTPFLTLAHAEGPIDEYIASWERVFNLGHGERSVATCQL